MRMRLRAPTARLHRLSPQPCNGTPPRKEPSMVTIPQIRIDRSKTLAEEPTTGHNRWHPDIPPAVKCDPGEEVILETRDAFDGQFTRDVPLDVVRAPNLDRLHPLTGPVYIN